MSNEIPFMHAQNIQLATATFNNEEGVVLLVEGRNFGKLDLIKLGLVVDEELLQSLRSQIFDWDYKKNDLEGNHG